MHVSLKVVSALVVHTVSLPRSSQDLHGKLEVREEGHQGCSGMALTH